jgi:hypothetical protein
MSVMSPRLAKVFVAAHGVGLLLLVLVVVAWLRLHRERRASVALGLAAIAAFTWLALGRVDAAAIPTRWITALQEGTTETNVGQLYGRGVHAGDGLRVIVAALSPGGAYGIRSAVRVNLWLAGVNAIAFFVAARLTLRRWITAALMTALFAANVVSLHAALSEVPAELVTAYFLAGALAAAVLDRHALAPAWARGAALALLALLTLFALSVAVARLRLGDEAAARLAPRALAWLSGLGRSGRLALAAALVASWLAAAFVLPGRASWAVQGLHPLNPTILTMPAVMLYFVPLGVAALSVLGVAHALRAPHRFFLAPLSLVVLYRIYYAAQSGFFELFRYLTLVMPIALFLALFGFRELEAIAARRAWGPRWRGAAAFGVAILCALFPLPGAVQLFVPGVPRLSPATLVLDRNQQREVRYLLELEGRFPDCALVTKVARRPNDPDRPLAPHEYDLVAFGRPLSGMIPLPHGDRGLAAAAATLPTPVSCALFYRGLDCNLTHGDRCADELRDLPVVDERTFGSAPYNTVSERGEPGPIVTLGVYRLR